MKRWMMAALFLGTLFVSFAHASGSNRTVFGIITIGDPIGNFPECAKSKRGFYAVLQKAICIETPSHDGMFTRIVFPAAESPAIAKNLDIVTWVKDGIVQGAEFITPGAGAGNIVFAELTKQYGKPTSITTNSPQRIGGGEFTDRTGIWELDEIKVTYWELYLNIDQGKVIVETPIGKQMREAWEGGKQPAVPLQHNPDYR